ncbi:MAG: hypothetical protein DME44_11715 [Verrucomicrobia bacterium]|nr:MAG: hypothetical protein DME44_11715 [Verrucomicrobiota bacterium]
MLADRRERRIVWNRRKGQDDIALAELEYFNGLSDARWLANSFPPLPAPQAKLIFVCCICNSQLLT